MNETYEFYVAGVKHHKLMSIPSEEFAYVDQLALELEPTNKYDGTAVKIFYERPLGGLTMLGYVPAKHSANVTYMIQNSRFVVCMVTEYNPLSDPWKMLKVKIADEGEVKINE